MSRNENWEGFEEAAGAGLAAWQSETVTAQSTASAAKIDVFDEDNYGAFTSVTNVPEKGITYTQADGAFTFDADGTYKITWNLFVSSAGTDTMTMSLEIAAGEIWTSSPIVHSAVDPTERSISITKEATAGQALHAFVDSDTATLIQVEPGTTMSIEKLGEIA